MATPTTSEDSAATFISRYASSLLGYGATCIRLEKNVGRIADAFGLKVDMTIMPRHIHLYFSDKETGCGYRSVMVATPHTPVSFEAITDLSRLSWEIADRHKDLSQAEQRFSEIINHTGSSRWAVTGLVSCSNAAFCGIFGGDIFAMAVVAAATFAGFWLKGVLLARKYDLRPVMFVCALISSILGSTDSLLSVGTTPAIAIGTSVLYLVPGIPFLNSFSDFVYRHYLCSFYRLADAAVLTCCLSAGLCAGMALMNTGMF